MTILRRGKDLLHVITYLGLGHRCSKAFIVMEDTAEEIPTFTELDNKVHIPTDAFTFLIILEESHNVRMVQRTEKLNLGIHQLLLELRLNRDAFASTNRTKLLMPHHITFPKLPVPAIPKNS